MDMVGTLSIAKLRMENIREVTCQWSYVSKHPNSTIVNKGAERFQVNLSFGLLQPGQKCVVDMIFTLCLDINDLGILLHPDILHIAYLQSDFLMKLCCFIAVKVMLTVEVSQGFSIPSVFSLVNSSGSKINPCQISLQRYPAYVLTVIDLVSFCFSIILSKTMSSGSVSVIGFSPDRT